MNVSLGPEFARRPLEVVDGIPVFSERDAYVENYEKIASDHVNAIEAGNENPFMDVGLWKLSEESTRRVFVEHVPAGAKVLDVGVGLGRVMAPLVQYDRFGIDIALDYLRHAQSRGLKVALSRIEDMPFVDDCFDAAVVCDVLEHVLDLNACVSQILRVVKPGGILIVRVPYKEDLSGYVDPSAPYEFVHLRNFDEHGLRLFFEKIMRCKVEYMERVVPLLSQAHLTVKLPPKGGALQQLMSRFEAEVEPPPPEPRETFVQTVVRRISLMFKEEQIIPDLQPPPDPLALLKYVAKVDDDQFFESIVSLRSHHPELYEMVAPHVTNAMEINVVIRKPSSAI